MSIEYAVLTTHIGADPIYMGVAHRSLWYRLMELLG